LVRVKPDGGFYVEDKVRVDAGTDTPSYKSSGEPGMKDHLKRDGCDHCGLKRAILTSDPADTMTAYSIERAKQQWYKAVEYAPIDEEERLPMILDHIDLWTNVSESSGTKIPIHHGQEYLDKDNKMTMVQPIVLLLP
jgi:hypothetical protein